MSDERTWYKDAVFYELRIPSFYDSDGDGIGDIRGLTERLDYLQDLGVTALWLLPFYPSPLRDDGYDIADYTSVNSQYGSLRDFRLLLREAHRRGLRVVTELVLNHTSDQHAWFQRARRAPAGSRWRDFYVWSDHPNRYPEARVIFKDFEHSNWTWDPEAKAYYWHRFYSHQPDLNFDNPEVRRALLQVVDFWFEMGVDGMRLDAVPYLYEREGTSCENLPETHGFLKDLRAHVDRKFANRMLLAEANQWPEDAVSYFGSGDECHMAFHFPIMPRLFMAIHMEDRYPILDILDQTPPIPDLCQWGLFLRNHDELTLEMVTDEERDYMWRVYARDRQARVNLGIRRRLAPLLGNNRRKIELMNGLLFSLPGTPILYYGDEIGMGDNVYLGDRNAVRTPMQWSPDRNAGFSRANPQRLFLPVIVDPEYHYEALNVETQQGNASSLLWWTKRIVALRRRFRAFGQGSLEPLAPSNRKVLAFLRRYEDETLLIVANLSRFSQYVELDLREFKGSVPVELWGNIEFPMIGELPYLLTLGPHTFYWFALQSPRARGPVELHEASRPTLEVDRAWENVLRGSARAELERALPAYVRSRRWFRSKAREIKSVRLQDTVPLNAANADAEIALVEVAYTEGDAETYILPVGFDVGAEPGEDALARLRVRARGAVVDGVLREVAADPRFASAMLDVVARRRRLRGATGDLYGAPARGFRRLHGREELAARALGVEQTNTSWFFGERLIGKLLRRLEDGMSPELEILRHLTERVGFPNVPALAGHVELRRGREEPVTVAIIQACVSNEGDAWSFTLDEVERHLEAVLPLQREGVEAPPFPASLVERVHGEPPTLVLEHIGSYLEIARLLGRRTAELHVALADAPDDPAFAPEPVNPFSQRSLSQSLRNLAQYAFDVLRGRIDTVPGIHAEAARRVLAEEPAIRERLRRVVDVTGGRRIRCHGDYHLGQILYTGKDFVIIDFEGEPARPLGERRLKRSPLTDVAGMLRSFHYAVESVIAGEIAGSSLRREDLPRLEPWARVWYVWTSSAFLRAYLDAIGGTGLVPAQRDELARLLDIYLLEKSLYELAYELNNRPGWVGIPLRGILEVLASAPGAS